jgi:hypothetical protein
VFTHRRGEHEPSGVRVENKVWQLGEHGFEGRSGLFRSASFESRLGTLLF